MENEGCSPSRFFVIDRRVMVETREGFLRAFYIQCWIAILTNINRVSIQDWGLGDILGRGWGIFLPVRKFTWRYAPTLSAPSATRARSGIFHLSPRDDGSTSVCAKTNEPTFQLVPGNQWKIVSCNGDIWNKKFIAKTKPNHHIEVVKPNHHACSHSTSHTTSSYC